MQSSRLLVVSSLLTLAVLLFSGCGGSSTLALQPDSGSHTRFLPLGSPLPVLPNDAGSAAAPSGQRQVSALNEFPGSGFIQASGATIDGDSVVLQSEAGQVAWALFKVTGLQGKYVDRFGVQTLPQGPGHPYTVGVSNYTDDRWEYLITGTLPEVEIDLTDNTKRLISQLGNLYYIVLVSNGDSVRMNLAWLNIQDEGGFGTPSTPTDFYVTEGEDSVIYVYWSYPEDTTSCELWRHADGQDWTLYQSTTTGFYMDTDVQIGVGYEYKVRAVNDVGHSAFTEPMSGYAAVYGEALGSSRPSIRQASL
jgi:hypothetical protein